MSDAALPLLSPSMAHLLISRSPLHAWQKHYLLGGEGVVDESTDAQERGKLLDRLIFGVGPDIAVVDADSWRTNAAKEAREIARAAGKLPVLEPKYTPLINLAAKLKGKMEAKGVILDGDSQARLLWESDGVKCKGKLDHLRLHAGVIYDLKTCENAAPSGLDRSMVNYGSDIQHAAYVEAVETLHPGLAGRVKMRFVYCEIEPPYEVVVAKLAGTMRQRGEALWSRAKATWKECLASGRWPGYSAVDEEIEVEAKPWALEEAVLPKGGSEGVTF